MLKVAPKSSGGEDHPLLPGTKLAGKSLWSHGFEGGGGPIIAQNAAPSKRWTKGSGPLLLVVCLLKPVIYSGILDSNLLPRRGGLKLK